MSVQTVRLLEADPELGGQLSEYERELARRLTVPAVRLGPGSSDLDRLLERSDLFAALLLDGLVMHRMAVGGRQILRLLGPGDIIVHAWAPRTEILGYTTKRAATFAHVALLGRPLVNAARHFPGLLVGLQLRLAEQHQRLAVQLGICQLPRVQDRVLTMLWLLAESWGKVTPQGTRLPLKLTHSAIGELIGAQRPTVSLAVRDLVDHEALLAQRDGWLLLGPPPAATITAPPSETPQIVAAPDRPAWRSGVADPVPSDPAADRERVSATVHGLRAVHAHPDAAIPAPEPRCAGSAR